MVFIKHNSLKSDIHFNPMFIPCFLESKFWRVQGFQGPDFSGSRFFRVRVQILEVATVMRCVNNGIVQAMSFFYTGRWIDHEINRWSSKYKNITKIPCLDIVLRYNKYMGGVDLCDMLIVIDHIKLETRKWYMHITCCCFSVAAANV